MLNEIALLSFLYEGLFKVWHMANRLPLILQGIAFVYLLFPLLL